MTSSATTAVAALAALLKRATLDDPEEVLRAADAALAKKKATRGGGGGGDGGDVVGALHARVVALLKLDRYEDALRTLEGQDGDEAAGVGRGGAGGGAARGGREGGEKAEDRSSKTEELRKRAPVERAYALYKVGRWDEACALAQQQQQQQQQEQEQQQQQAFLGARDRRAFKHIEAQANYRLENFADAAKLYRQLAAEPSDVENEDVDIRINRSAVEAQQLWRARSQGGSLGDSLADGGGRTKPTREDLEAFEMTYNAACCSVAAGEYARADFLLKRATELCDALDDLSEEEKRAESFPIIAQHVYVLLKLNKRAEAQALSDKIANYDTSDMATRRIAQNNKLVLSHASAPAPASATNPYHAQRLFHAHAAGTNQKKGKKNDALYGFQASILQRNAYVLDMATFKHSGVATSTAAYLARQRHPSLSPHVNAVSVVNVAAHARSQAGKAAGLKEALALLGKRPRDVGLLLTAVQLYASQNNYDAAASLTSAFLKRLEEKEERRKEEEKEEAPSSGGEGGSSSSSNDDTRDKDARYAPGLIALYVTLLRKQSGRHGQVREELKKAALHWRARLQQQQQQQQQQHYDADQHYQRYRPLFRAAAVELMKSRKRADAALAGELFAELRQRNAADRVAVAGHIAATARTDLRRASALIQAQGQQLTPAARLVAGVNAEELEMAGVPTKQSLASASPPSSLTASAGGGTSGRTGGGVTQRAGKKRKAASSVGASKKQQQQQPARKRIKKSRLPKDYDPAKPPDPERWRPLRERSYYKPKVRKGKGRLASTRTQGGFAPESQEKSAAEQAAGVGGGGGGADASKAEIKKKAPVATASGGNKKGKGGKR